MRLFFTILFIIIAILMITGIAVYRFENPELTMRQLLIETWPMCFGALFSGTIILAINKKVK